MRKTLICFIILIIASCSSSYDDEKNGLNLRLDCEYSTTFKTLIFSDDHMAKVDWESQRYYFDNKKFDISSDINNFNIDLCYGGCKIIVSLNGKELYVLPFSCDASSHNLDSWNSPIIFISNKKDRKEKFFKDGYIQLLPSWKKNYQYPELTNVLYNSKVRNYLQNKNLLTNPSTNK